MSVAFQLICLRLFPPILFKPFTLPFNLPRYRISILFTTCIFGFSDSPTHLVIWFILGGLLFFIYSGSTILPRFLFTVSLSHFILHSQLYEPNTPFFFYMPTRVGERNKTCQPTDIHIPEGNLACFEMGFLFDSALQLFSLSFYP